MLAIVDDKIPFLAQVLEPCGIEVRYLPGAAITAADVRDADLLLVRTRTRCDAALLAASRVRFVGSATIGIDHLDTDYLDRRGIRWCNAPGCNAASVAQYVVSVLVNYAVHFHRPLAGLTFGIIGAGNVGSRVAAAARALGMRVLLNDPPRAEREQDGRFLPLDVLLPQADVISMHVPLVDGSRHPSRHLAGEKFFEQLPPGTLLLNSGRGEVVDSEALKRALQRQSLTAVLDVWENEPAIDRTLQELLWLGTPHIAGYSLDGKANGTAQVVRALAEFFQLPLRDFRPADLPAPTRSILHLPDGLPPAEELQRAVNFSYDVRRDDAALRRDPGCFEFYRGNYPRRREFGAFTIHNASAAVAGVLSELGFQS